MSHFTPRRKHLAGVAGLILLAFPLAACGDDDGGSEGGSDSAPQALAAIPALKGETTAVKLDTGFTDALGTLKLTPGVFGTAKLTDGSLVFPITGGNVSVYTPGEVENYVVGQIQHEGSGFTLTAGGTEVAIGNFNVDPGISKVYGDVSVNGEVAATSVDIFDLDGRTLMPLAMEGSNAVLEGTKVLLTDTAAGLLGSTFDTDAVAGGLLIGVAKITVNTK
ncbi:MAG: hypothetical protein WKF79_13500 [Nocardioides sp.]